MQYNKDFISREIQRLISFLQNLIGEVKSNNSDDFFIEFQKLENELEQGLGLNLSEILELEDSVLINKLANIDFEILEKLVELMSVLDSNKIKGKLNMELLFEKGNLILDFIDRETRTYSFKREELKTLLRN